MKHCLSNKLQRLGIGSTLESSGISFVIIMCDWVMYTLQNMIYDDIGNGSVYSISLNLFCRRKLCRKCKYANLNQMKNLIKMCRNIWHNISKFRGPLNAFLLFLRRENYVNVDILHRSQELQNVMEESSRWMHLHEHGCLAYPLPCVV